MVAILALSNGFILEGMTGASRDAPEAFQEALGMLLRGGAVRRASARCAVPIPTS